MLLLLLFFTPIATAILAREMVDDTAQLANGQQEEKKSKVIPGYAYNSHSNYVFPYSNYLSKIDGESTVSPFSFRSVLPAYAYYPQPDFVFPYANYHRQTGYYDKSDDVIPAPYYGSYRGKEPLYEGYRILADDRKPKEVVAAMKVTEGESAVMDEVNRPEKIGKQEEPEDAKAIPIY